MDSWSLGRQLSQKSPLLGLKRTIVPQEGYAWLLPIATLLTQSLAQALLCTRGPVAPVA